MKKYIVKFYRDRPDHIFASPILTDIENIEATAKNLDKYITSQKDYYGSSFKKLKKSFMKFQYTSNNGGVIVKEYKKPEFKKL